MKTTAINHPVIFAAVLAVTGILIVPMGTAANLLPNSSFETPALAAGDYVGKVGGTAKGDTTFNSYSYNNLDPNETYCYNLISRSATASVFQAATGNNYLLLGGSAGPRPGVTTLPIGAVSSTTQMTHYVFSIKMWTSTLGNGTYAGNDIVMEYSGGGLGNDGANYIYLQSANQDAETGQGNVLAVKSNDNFSLIANLKNESVTLANPVSNFADTYQQNTWNILTLSWDLVANSYVDGNSKFQVYIQRPGGEFPASGGWTAFDDISLTATVIPEPAALTLLGLGVLALFRRRRS